MTKDELTLGLQSVLRHILTVGAGALAAHGVAGGEQLVGLAGGVAVFVGTVGWSLVSKSKLLEQLCAAAPASELEGLAGLLGQFRANGSNPLLIANIAQTAMAIANQELLAAHPELAPAPTPTPPPQPSPPEPQPAVAAVPQGEILQ